MTFYRHGRRALLALLTASLLLLTACSGAPKNSWADWIAEREASAATSAQRSTAATATSPLVSTSAHPTPTLSPADAAPLALSPGYAVGDGARVGPGFDLAMRNPDFPRTAIAEIHVDVASPHHHVRLVWTGPGAAEAPTGPWRSNIGRGNPGMNCDDVEESNITDSRCTPKGTFFVAGFVDHLNACPTAHYCTWVVHAPRYVALHSHGDIPTYPASAGCIRLDRDVAKLIHNNSIAGVTLIHIAGRWSDPRDLRQ